MTTKKKFIREGKMRFVGMFENSYLVDKKGHWCGQFFYPNLKQFHGRKVRLTLEEINEIAWFSSEKGCDMAKAQTANDHKRKAASWLESQFKKHLFLITLATGLLLLGFLILLGHIGAQIIMYLENYQHPPPIDPGRRRQLLT
jgi:hypothetical protein